FKILCDLLGLCQREPSFGQNEPRPFVLAIVATVCLAKAFSCFNSRLSLLSDIAAIMIPKAYLFLSHCRSALATGEAKRTQLQGADARWCKLKPRPAHMRLRRGHIFNLRGRF